MKWLDGRAARAYLETTVAALLPGFRACFLAVALLAATVLAPLPCRAATSRVSVQFYWGGVVAVGGLTIAFWVGQSFDSAGRDWPRVEPALLNLEGREARLGVPALRLRAPEPPAALSGEENPPALELDLLRIRF